MTVREKKRKAALMAVAYYLEQEVATSPEKDVKQKQGSNWVQIGRTVSMSNRTIVQRRGRVL